ncbi:hypothetical protein P8452_57727 [Trifolium repens]|nr:hypothetical protein P8452_57727 [Trifolium repens]
MNNYNILLACPAKTSFDLCHSATIMWQWSLMLKGDFTGKHFMFPPDWYGDLKVPRENPFSAAKVPTSSQSAEIHMPSSDIKLGEVPKSVSRQQPHCKQLKEDKVSVSVWWDFDYCGVPSGVSVSKIAPSITGALRTNGINGPIDFRAYGDVSHFSKFEQTTLSLTGIHLCNITDEMKKNRKRKKTCDYLFLDLANWVFNNPPPFHLFIICGDVSINGLWMLHDLRMSNYNILVACPGRTYDVLRSATTIMWHWSSILKGEDLTGKHFNYPPDGPFDSWYGDSRVNLENPFSAADGSTSSQAEILEYIESGELSKVTLENPFSTAEESTYSQNAEIHEPSSDIQSSEVPESVSRQVKNNKQRDSTSTQKRIDTSRILAWNTFSM